MRLPILLCCTTALTMWSAEVVCHREGYVTRRGTVKPETRGSAATQADEVEAQQRAMAARQSALSELQKQLKSQVGELEEARAFARSIRQGSSVLKAMFCNLLPVKAEKASGRRPGAQQPDVRVEGAVRPASFRVDL
jgi:hypothetical protein